MSRVPRRNKTTASSKAQTSSTAAPSRCDVCLMRDGWRGHCLQKCRTCGVNVHDACYGLAPNTEKLPDFECWACQSVGQEIEGRHLFQVDRKKRKLPGFCEEILQETRPTECVLCSVKTGNHAMHRLYDAPTKAGRQIIMPETDKQPMRLAWVHTICAFIVTNHTGTRGSVYACDEDGNFDEEELEEDEEQDSDEDEEKHSGKATHHFVMCGLDMVSDSEERESITWVQALETHRQELKCYICGRDDTNALRVPLQCCAGNTDEFEDFKAFHEHLEEPCVQAMHAGCVHYGQSSFRHCWFYPGTFHQDDDEAQNDPVGQIFCTAHARELVPASSETTGTTNAALSRQQVAKKGILVRTSTAEYSTGVPAPKKKKKGAKMSRDEPELSVPRKKKSNSKVASSASQDTGDSKSVARASGGDIIDPKHRWTKDGCFLPAHPPEKRSDGTYARPSGRSPNGLEWDYNRGLYVPKGQKNQKMDQTKADNDLDNDILERMTDDVAEAVKISLDSDGEDLFERVNHCRKHWMQGMNKEVFKVYWEHVQLDIQKKFPKVFSEEQEDEHVEEQKGEQDDTTMMNDGDEDGVVDDDDNAMLDYEEEEPDDDAKPTSKPGDDPWAHLWADGAKPFEFQGWDTYEEIVLPPIPRDHAQSTTQDEIL